LSKCIVEVWNRAFSKIFKTQQQCITSAFNQLEKLKFQMTNQRNEIKSKVVLQEPKVHLPEKISSTVNFYKCSMECRKSCEKCFQLWSHLQKKVCE
jgi:hypothetical protein